MSVETDKICRTCLCLTGPLLSIYDGDANNCVAEMLKEITNLRPTLQDNMPPKVCLTCISEINRCFSFKMKCENSNRTLRQLIPNAVPEERKRVYDSRKPATELCDKSSQTCKSTKIEQKSVEVQTDEQQTINILSSAPMDKAAEIIAERFEETDDTFVVNEASCNNAFAYDESSNEANEPIKRNVEEVSNISNAGTVTASLKTTSAADDDFDNYAIECLEDGSEYVVEVKHVSKINDRQLSVELENVLVTPSKNHATKDGAAVYEITQTDKFAQKRQTSAYEVETFETAEHEVDKDPYQKIINVVYDTKRKRNEYKCSECPQTFISLNVLRRHLTKFHHMYVSEEITEKTEQLHEEPTFLTELLDSSKRNYFCGQCNASFTTKRSMDIHLKKNICNKKCNKCVTCERVFETLKQLETHANEHVEKSIECIDCNAVFATQEMLTEHQIEKHKRKLQHQCNVCKKVFTMASTLKDHLRIHTGDKPFQCPACGKAFAQKSNLKQHMQRHEKTKNFKCTDCDDSFVTRSELFSHQRTHTRAQPFKCEYCTAAFSTNSTLNKHRRSHTGERPYACDICPMRFAALNVLKNHRRLHTGEKPFSCPVCKKKFTQQGDCTIHLKTHDNAKCHHCLCGKQYPIPSRLVKHQKTCKFIKKEVDVDDGDADDLQKSSDEIIEQNLAKMCDS